MLEGTFTPESDATCEMITRVVTYTEYNDRIRRARERTERNITRWHSLQIEENF